MFKILSRSTYNKLKASEKKKVAKLAKKMAKKPYRKTKKTRKKRW